MSGRCIPPPSEGTLGLPCEVGERLGNKTTPVDAEAQAVAPRMAQPARGSVRRGHILQLLEQVPSGSLVVVQAPAGYGKTTLLSQIAGERSAETSLLRLDPSHNDPVHLLGDLDFLCRSMGVVDGRADPEGVRSVRSVGALVSRIDPRVPAVLLIDEAEALTSTESRDVLAQLAIDAPPSVTLVIATRSDIGLPLATLRTSGRVIELSADDLALTAAEIGELAEHLGVDGQPELVTRVGDRMEGWPVGVYLMLLAAASGTVRDPEDIRGDDIHLADYLDAQVLDGLSPEQQAFLAAVSVLDEMTGPLCDWLLERTGSQLVLDDLADANLLIARLDHAGERFRLHAILREYLHERLHRTDAGAHRTLHLRASDWYEQHGDPIEAVRHAMQVDDADRVAALVRRHGQPLFDGGRVETVSRWFRWFDRDEHRDRYPAIALMAAMAAAAQADEVAARRWKAVVDGHRGTLGDLEPLACFLDALTEADGTETMLADAQCAVRGLGPESSWHPAAVTLEGLALLAGGEIDAAEERLLYAAEAGFRYASLTAATFSYAVCSLLAAFDGRHARAGELATRAIGVLDETDLGLHATSVLSLVASARWQMGRGETEVARRTLNRAYGSVPRLSPLLPGISAFTLVEMAAVAMELADVSGARQVLGEAERVMRDTSLGRIEERYRSLVEIAEATPGGDAGVSSLTPAELRLLPYLATHLSFPEIGERLFISRHTVKTQAMAIYRKLGASTRSEAVSTARAVGLLPTQRL